ncbi:putative ribonuclease H-like domain-containing protein [Tanacetum coccineum]
MLRSKDEAPAFIINFLKMIQVRLKETVRRIRTDNGTEFVNQTLREYYEKVGISHETSVARSPQQNGVVERRNRTLIEAARTMLIYAKAPLFLWAEAVATACYTQNRSMIRRRHGKTPYELLHNKPPDLSYLHVFGALCYPTNDSENLGKLQPKADIGIFIGYAPTKKAFRIYNRRTRRIIETIHVDFDELTAMASEHSSSGPALHEMTPVSISSGLVPNPSPSTPFVPPTRSDWDLLFQPMFDESLNVDFHAPEVIAPIPEAVAPEHAVSTGSPSSTTVDQDAPSPSNSHTPQETQTPIISHDVEEDNHDIEVAHMGNDPYFGIPIPEVTSDQSSSSVIIHTIVPPDHHISEHNSKWTKDHPLENIIGALDRPVSTRLQLHEQALFCYYDAFLTSVEPKNYKEALTQACWIEAMQEELHEFERLEVWELVPPPDKAFVISLKWIYKVKLDELGGILKNKARLVARGYRQEEGIDFRKSHCSGCKISGFRIFSSIAAHHYHGHLQMDVKTVLLNVDTPYGGEVPNSGTKEGNVVDPSHFVARPTEKHLNAVKRIFRYLKGTVHRGLWYPKDSSFAQTNRFADGIMLLSRYSRSTSGTEYLPCLVVVPSPLDEITTSRYGLEFNKMPMYCDNKSAIALACNNVQKHFQIKAYRHPVSFHQGACENGVIELYFVNTEYQLADIFTKALGRERIEFLINNWDMRSVRRLMAVSIADQIALDDAFGSNPSSGLMDVLKLSPYYKAFQVTAACPSPSLSAPDSCGGLKPLVVRGYLPVALTNEDIRNSESYKEYYAMASGTIPPKTKGSKKKANTDAIPKQKPPTAPKEKKYGKGKQKITKRSRQETHSSQASGSGADEGTGVTPGVPDAPDYDSEDDISWKSSDDDQDDEQDQDDEGAEKHDVHESTQEDEDDDEHDDDEKVQDDDEHDVDETIQEDDDEELTESDDDGDDFVHPKLTTHDDEIIHEEDTDEDDSSISSSDEEDSDNDVEGANVAGAKSDEDATDEKDQGNEAVKDTNTDLDGRDKVMTDVEDTHVTLTPVNPDGQQQSSSVSSGFVSNMLNPNQDTGVDDIFRQHTEATSLIDTSVTAIMEPSFTAQINRPPTPHPIIIQPQQLPILTPATTTSSSLQNLPNFASLFGFDHRLKAMQWTLQSILKYDRIRERLLLAKPTIPCDNDDGMKKNHQGNMSKGSLPKLFKGTRSYIISDQLESEVLVRSSKEANTSHAVAANLSKLELKKILIDKMEANHLYQKDHSDGADDDVETSAGNRPGVNRRRSGKEPASTSAPSETTTKTAGKTTSTGSKTHKKSASQSAPVGEAMHSTDIFKGPADQEFETGVQDEQAEEEVQHLPDWFQKPTRLPSPDHAWNTSVPAVHETVQPCGKSFELMKGTCKSLTELEYFCEEVYKATTEKLDWINPEGRQYPHDLRQPLPLVPNSQGRRVIPFHHFINNDLEYLRGGVSSRKYSTSVTKTKAADYGHIKWIEDLVPNSMWSQTVVKYDKFALWGISHWGKKRRQFYAFATLRESARDVYSKRRIIAVTKVEIVEWHDYKHLDWITVRRDDDALYKFKEGDLHRLRIQDIEDMLLLLVQGND